MWFGIGGALVALIAALTWLTFYWAGAGRLARNAIIGIRTQQTRKSDTAWSEAHHAAMMRSTAFMIAAVVAGMAALVQMGNQADAAFAFWLAVAVYAIGMAQSVWRAIRVAEAAK
ncbi:MAG: SdpI family protein [Agromyces sp.]